jgi:hypothetical protein
MYIRLIISDAAFEFISIVAESPRTYVALSEPVLTLHEVKVRGKKYQQHE